MRTGVRSSDRVPRRIGLVDLLRCRPILEGGLEQLVGEEADGVEHVGALGLGLAHQLGGDLRLFDDLAVVAAEVDGLHLDEIDDAFELGLEADRQLQHHRVVAELVAQRVGHPLGVGAGAVALVDEGDARHLVALHLAVDGDRLRLHAGHRAQHQHGAVEHPQRALHLDGEVDVAGGVDDVDVVALPLHIGGGGGDGDAALPLQLHVVHGRADAVLALDVVDRVDLLGVEQDPLGERGLARVDVGRDPDVADLLDVADHGVLANAARAAISSAVPFLPGRPFYGFSVRGDSTSPGVSERTGPNVAVRCRR